MGATPCGFDSRPEHSADLVRIIPSTFVERRCFLWDFDGTAGTPKPVLPSAGGNVEGVAGGAYTNPNPPPSTLGPTSLYARCPGLPFRVEAFGGFAAFAALVTDAAGRLGTGTGTTVAVALQSSGGSGSIVWAKWA